MITEEAIAVVASPYCSVQAKARQASPMNTKPTPRGLPSTIAPTVTQAMPASVYGNQARAALDGAAFMTIRLTREAERLA